MITYVSPLLQIFSVSGSYSRHSLGLLMLCLFARVLFCALFLPTVTAGPFPSKILDSGGVEQASTSFVQIANLDTPGVLQQSDKDPVKSPSDQDSLESSFPIEGSVALDNNESEDLSPGLGNPTLEIPGNLPLKVPKIAYLDFLQKETSIIPGTNPTDPCPDHTDGIISLCCDPNTIEYDEDGIIRKVYGCTACMPLSNFLFSANCVHQILYNIRVSA